METEIVCPFYGGNDDVNVVTYSSVCHRYAYAYAFFSRHRLLDASASATFDPWICCLSHACPLVEAFAYYPVAPIHLMHWPTFLVDRLLSASFLPHLSLSRPAICASALFLSVSLPLPPSPSVQCYAYLHLGPNSSRIVCLASVHLSVEACRWELGCSPERQRGRHLGLELTPHNHHLTPRQAACLLVSMGLRIRLKS